VRPLVEAFGYGECHAAELPGKGQRVVTCRVEGLEPEQPFHEAGAFRWAARLAEQAEAIRAELRRYQGSPEDWVAAPEGTWGTMDAPEWKALGLVQASSWVMGEHFPETRAALNALPGLCPDEVMFARMPPGTKIGPHSDNMNFILVAHLGLELEDGLCTLRVGDWTRAWREGEVLVFDHTFVHSAANDSQRDRYVLICRFWHPGLAAEERYALQFLLRAIAAMQRRGQELQAAAA